MVYHYSQWLPSKVIERNLKKDARWCNCYFFMDFFWSSGRDENKRWHRKLIIIGYKYLWEQSNLNNTNYT